MALPNAIQPLVSDLERAGAAGRNVAASLLADLERLCEEARAHSLRDLERAAEAAGRALGAVAGSDEAFGSQAESILAHLRELAGYAQLVQKALEAGDDPGRLAVPSPLDPDRIRNECHPAESVQLFAAQAAGTLADLEEELLGQDGRDLSPEMRAALRGTLRSLHSEFAVLGFGRAAGLCRAAEEALAEAPAASLPSEPILKVVDWLAEFVGRLAEDRAAEEAGDAPLLEALRSFRGSASAAVAGDEDLLRLVVEGEFADSLSDFITEARGHLAEAEAAMVEFSSAGRDAEQINLTFRAFHTIKGVAGFLNLAPVVELAHAAEALLDASRSGRLSLSEEHVDLILRAGDLIGRMLDALEGKGAPSAASHRMLVGSLERAVQGGSPESAPPESAPPESRGEPNGAGKYRAPAGLREKNGGVPEDALRADAPPLKALRVERTVRVNTARLDALVDMVGELVIAQSMVLQNPAIARLDDHRVCRDLGQVAKITRDLQNAAMALRMVALRSTFQKMGRLVRDVASKSGKRVRFAIQGEETELDRNVVEQIGDPLVHLLRNSVDHGIEPPDRRAAAGKDPEGRLWLRAYHKGGSIVIEIEDDGGGIDRERILEKARERGLVPAGAGSDSLSDEELFQMIFLPGFSTAEKVTDISGRGVGLDVVRRNIEALRGKVEIESEPGRGTTFRLRLPLTLAIIDGMVLRVGSQRFVLPTLAIERSFRPDRVRIHRLVGRGECADVSGAILPVYRLGRCFSVPDALEDLDRGILVVVESNGQRSCLFVDEILGQQQVVIKSLGAGTARIPGVSGGAIMGDGRVALILDVASLVESAAGCG
ncbi:MAG: hypothetical protein Fur0037_12270 [Planctomycetota bacterium]